MSRAISATSMPGPQPTSRAARARPRSSCSNSACLAAVSPAVVLAASRNRIRPPGSADVSTALKLTGPALRSSEIMWGPSFCQSSGLCSGVAWLLLPGRGKPEWNDLFGRRQADPGGTRPETVQQDVGYFGRGTEYRADGSGAHRERGVPDPVGEVARGEQIGGDHGAACPVPQDAGNRR